MGKTWRSVAQQNHLYSSSLCGVWCDRSQGPGTLHRKPGPGVLLGVADMVQIHTIDYSVHSFICPYSYFTIAQKDFLNLIFAFFLNTSLMKEAGNDISFKH